MHNYNENVFSQDGWILSVVSHSSEYISVQNYSETKLDKDLFSSPGVCEEVALIASQSAAERGELSSFTLFHVLEGPTRPE